MLECRNTPIAFDYEISAALPFDQNLINVQPAVRLYAQDQIPNIFLIAPKNDVFCPALHIGFEDIFMIYTLIIRVIYDPEVVGIQKKIF